jgi:hypothetical protein
VSFHQQTLHKPPGHNHRESDQAVEIKVEEEVPEEMVVVVVGKE